jgi:hypothetical protein
MFRRILSGLAALTLTVATFVSFTTFATFATFADPPGPPKHRTAAFSYSGAPASSDWKS